MQKGFIFNANLCVACNACRAACILENGWSASPREIYTLNSETDPDYPVVNLSMACNHCGKPVCLTGCPAGAYSKDPATSAIIHDEKKCIGCNYCIWNCPYSAPKQVNGKGVIEKCNLCLNRITEGLSPACSDGCPTGALAFGDINPATGESVPGWIPDKKLDPRIEIRRKIFDKPEIIPAGHYNVKMKKNIQQEKSICGEWSLILFSFVSTISLSIFFSSLIKGIFPDPLLVTLLLTAAAVLSLFHLGRPFRSWRSVTNMKSSPLSREILTFIIFTVLAVAAAFFQSPGLLAASVISGLILLIIIDSVYLFTSFSGRLFLHSGQTFLTGLLLTSAFAGLLLPLFFISAIKLISGTANLMKDNKESKFLTIRFIRLALLSISVTALLTGVTDFNFVITGILITGELIDRITYYYDFNPVNINTLISTYSN